jgi:hypothetical protein
MNTMGMWKAALLAVLALAAFAAAAPAEQMMFMREGWLCASPEAYEQAVAEQKQRNAREWETLKKEQLDKKACIYVGREEIQGIIAPYVSVLETRGDKMNVSFFVKYDERLELLHHRLNWLKYTGWTDVTNLVTVASIAR